MLYRVRRLVVVCVAMVLGLGLLAACSDDDERPGTVPSDGATSNATKSSAASPTAAGTVEDEIVEVYERYWVFLRTDAIKVLPDDLLATLKTVSVDPQLTAAYEAIQRTKAAGEIPFGDIEFGAIEFAVISENAATLQECRDETGLGTKREATGEITSEGRPNVFYQTSMILDGDGKWKLESISRRPDGC